MKREHWPIVLLFAAYACHALFAIFFGERIPVKGGLGWDGEIYYFISQDFMALWHGNVFDSYYIQRIVPSLLVKAMHWVSDTEHSYELTGTYFGLLNLASMLGGTVLLLSALREVNTRWRWMATMFALVSFGAMKHPYYYPILTDSFAFLLGAAMLWAYLRQRKWILAAVALIGAFTFPSIMLMALPLLVFNEKGSGHYPTVPTDRVLIVLLLLMIAALALLGPAFCGLMPFGTMQPSRLMVLVSLPFVLLYVTTLWWDVGIVQRLRASIVAMDRKGLALWAMLFIVVAALKLWTKPSPFTFSYFALHSVAYGVVHPAVWLVAHVIYFGPVFLLMLFFWKQVKQTLLRLPLPLFWCMMFTFMLTIRSESRTLIAGLPFILYIMVLAMRDVPLKAWQQAAMLGVAVALSKVWFPINEGMMTGDFLQFPMQRYFMHIGSWMSEMGYAINGATVVAVGVAVWAIMRPWKRLSGISQKG